MDTRYQVTDAFTMVHPITLTHGSNARVWDTDEQSYIDFVGGIGVLNFGHCQPKIVEAITQQAQSLIHYAYNAAGHLPYQTLMPRLCRWVAASMHAVNAATDPASLSAQDIAAFDTAPYVTDIALSGMLTNSGAEATENALKIARLKTKRVGVIAFDGGFHGRTLAAVNLNGKVAPYKRGLGALAGAVYHIPFPSPDNAVSDQHAIDALTRLFDVETDVDNIGAFILEPVQGEGGFQRLSPSFAQYLRAFCDVHGIVLIMDEIQSGYGRTGVPFAFMHLGITPDLLLLGKSIAGGLPLGAVIGTDALMNDLPKGSLGGTYSGNPVACAAANATFDLMADAATWESVAHYSEVIAETVSAWQADNLSPWLHGLTGVGAMRGIELRHDVAGKNPQVMAHILSEARARGLLLMPSGKYRHIIRLLPPLTIEPETLQQGLAILKDVLKTIPAHFSQSSEVNNTKATATHTAQAQANETTATPKKVLAAG
ncbi:aspartate aminotransferase family protein [Psychrobacter aestuarii]|uniref:Aspartate aminotransferase family protein n=1 Tax=Psychrobacter aestuarii TaxID=556327 RepID=A0ABP3FI28_9GAMM|nr:aspartate aminotransferase family protein [Psychrobacter aestuarii]